MAEELEATPPVQPNNDAELQQLRESVKKLEAKNHELIGKMQKKELIEVPDDYEQLKEFKRQAEQIKLEQAGEYTKAKETLEQQYRDKSAADKKRIEELELRNRELELIGPAIQALSEITHDPELVLNNLLPKDQLQMKDGKPFIIDGYEQLPVDEYVKNKLEKEKPYLLKTRSISGGGAPITKPSSNGQFSEEMLKPFLKETENQTEQHRIASVYGVETWQKLRDIAESR
tara:strand:+ start:5679 stop:6371 length:693 start_codon:yes stop_codon:yes gene_type:complete